MVLTPVSILKAPYSLSTELSSSSERRRTIDALGIELLSLPSVDVLIASTNCGTRLGLEADMSESRKQARVGLHTRIWGSPVLQSLRQ